MEFICQNMPCNIYCWLTPTKPIEMNRENPDATPTPKRRIPQVSLFSLGWQESLVSKNQQFYLYAREIFLQLSFERKPMLAKNSGNVLASAVFKISKKVLNSLCNQVTLLESCHFSALFWRALRSLKSTLYCWWNYQSRGIMKVNMVEHYLKIYIFLQWCSNIIRIILIRR